MALVTNELRPAFRGHALCSVLPPVMSLIPDSVTVICTTSVTSEGPQGQTPTHQTFTEPLSMVDSHAEHVPHASQCSKRWPRPHNTRAAAPL